jgi:hypothetical protein
LSIFSMRSDAVAMGLLCADPPKAAMRAGP